MKNFDAWFTLMCQDLDKVLADLNRPVEKRAEKIDWANLNLAQLYAVLTALFKLPMTHSYRDESGQEIEETHQTTVRQLQSGQKGIVMDTVVTSSNPEHAPVHVTLALEQKGSKLVLDIVDLGILDDFTSLEELLRADYTRELNIQEGPGGVADDIEIPDVSSDIRTKSNLAERHELLNKKIGQAQVVVRVVEAHAAKITEHGGQVELGESILKVKNRLDQATELSFDFEDADIVANEPPAKPAVKQSALVFGLMHDAASAHSSDKSAPQP